MATKYGYEDICEKPFRKISEHTVDVCREVRGCDIILFGFEIMNTPCENSAISASCFSFTEEPKEEDLLLSELQKQDYV